MSSLEQINTGVTSSVHNELIQLTSQMPGGVRAFSRAVNEPPTVTLDGKEAVIDAGKGNSDFVASPDAAGGWHGWAEVTTGANAIALIATDVNSNVTTKTINVTVSGGTARTLTYDANGNLTDNGSGQTYSWNAADRLTTITYSDGSRSEFVYDGQGRRVKIVEKDDTGTVTSEKRFVWCDGPQPCEERHAST